MRISREQMFMQVAHTVAQRSTCHRLNVGAVLVVDSNIVSMGYNGARSGQEHCGGTSCGYYQPPQGCSVVHAEVNALLRAPPGIQGGSLFVTHSPCLACARMIATVGIDSLYFETEYRSREGIDHLLLDGSKVIVRRLQPSGYLTDLRTGEIIRL